MASGLTVTVIVKAAPVHVPVEEGVTIYSTVPAVALLGLLVFLIAPEPAVAPVILPVMVPMVQVKLLEQLPLEQYLDQFRYRYCSCCIGN
jgi:ABC-type proline/glycine betaine transport system permease subunit